MTLQNSGFDVMHMITSGVSSISEVYEIAVRTVPMGIPMGPNLNWDGFLGSAWEGITELPDIKRAIIWQGSLSMMTKSLGYLLCTGDIFELNDGLI
jgi:hypothetical protein